MLRLMRFLANPFRDEDQINAAFCMFLLPGADSLRKQRKDVMFTHETPGRLACYESQSNSDCEKETIKNSNDRDCQGNNYHVQDDLAALCRRVMLYQELDE